MVDLMVLAAVVFVFGLGEHTVLLLGEIALAIVLFTDAAGINLSALYRLRPPGREDDPRCAGEQSSRRRTDPQGFHANRGSEASA